MTIPDFQSCFLPILTSLNKSGQLSRLDLVDSIADHFRLTVDERRELLPSGKQEIIGNRVGWAQTYLKKGELYT